jgi:hypothetical protein
MILQEQGIKLDKFELILKKLKKLNHSFFFVIAVFLYSMLAR